MYASDVHDTTTPLEANNGNGRTPRESGSDPAAIAVSVHGLGKRYGELWALRDLDLVVPRGTVLGLLGHNGAGKTTAIRILTTLALPSEGSAAVAGHDVVVEPDAVRRSIGVAAQDSTVDGLLTARGNLVMVGRLHGQSRRVAQRQADALLAQVDLVDAADKLAKELSGGMRRRLDLAASLMSDPAVLFLDEPTTGLDPRSRNELWDLLRRLVRDGTTIILTTQYLEEADRLADDVIVLDHGVTVAHGTPQALKAQIGGDRVDVSSASAQDLERIVAATLPFVTQPASIDADAGVVTIPVRADVRLIDVMHAVDDAGIDVVDMNRRQATLDDVFLILTESHR
jgi:ABC-2 type transport system ATP-binding protein